MNGSLMSGLVDGYQQGSTFENDADRKAAEEARKVKADARLDQNQNYAEQGRDQQRKVWTDANKNQDELDAIRARYKVEDEKANADHATSFTKTAQENAAPANNFAVGGITDIH